MSLKYEDLVTDPETNLRAICEFVGEPFYPAMMDPETWPRVGSYDITPVATDKVGKWRQEPFPQLPQDLQDHFKTALAELGYPADTSEPVSAAEGV